MPMRSALRATFSLVCPIVACLGFSLSVTADDAAQLEKWQQAFDHDILPIIRDRCLECHSGAEADGGFDVSQFTSGELVAKKMDLWDEVGKRVRLKEMPPEGSPQLNDAQKGAFHRWLDSRPRQNLCSQLANDETQAWYRGFVMSRRLTRTEYLNAVRDVVGIEPDPLLQLPSDGSGGEGFDTNGDTLFTSPIHIEQYLEVASQTIDTALLTELPQEDEAKRSMIERARTRLLAPLPEPNIDESAAAKIHVARFARRAWRRPVTDEEATSLCRLYQAARERGTTFEAAVGESFKAALVSPNFLFVVEAEAPQGGVQRLTPHELATRLALFLWSSVPDDELLRAADAGELDTDEQVIAQTYRMLEDPKARALGENFGMQWLGLANFLTTVKPDHEIYPEYNEQLASDLREEAIRFVAGVFQENRSLLELIDASYVHVNGRLASHYQMELPADAPWQRVDTSERRRGGVITLGAALMSSSYPRRTSPVLRGRWVLEEVLGSQVPPPPPGVPALEESVANHALSLRERLEEHRKNPECAACHSRMDPLGFGLENFDGLGRWRDKDGEAPIDASGRLPSGETFAGPEELKQILLRRSGEFERHLVRKLLGFALGRELNKFDDCVIDASLEKLAQHDHRAGVVIETIVTSYPFQHRYFKAAETPATEPAK